MTPEDVERKLVECRPRFAALLVRFKAGERSALHSEALELTDMVVCLLDDAPRETHEAIHRLADGCEDLLRRIAH